jgi:hypothetical protein
MKALILVCRDGARHLAFVAPAAFDTQAWAQSRREAFALLRVVRVVEEYA